MSAELRRAPAPTPSEAWRGARTWRDADARAQDVSADVIAWRIAGGRTQGAYSRAGAIANMRERLRLRRGVSAAALSPDMSQRMYECGEPHTQIGVAQRFAEG